MDYPDDMKEFTAPQDAFEDKSPQGSISQAAFLLTLGLLLRREYEAGWGEMRDYDPKFPGLDPMPMEGIDYPDFVNLLRELLEKFGLEWPIWPFADLSLMHPIYWTGDVPPEDGDRFNSAMREVAGRLFNHPGPETAARLIALGAQHPNQMVAVCSTISLLNVLRAGEWGPVFGRLAAFTLRSPFANVRDLAGRVLGLATQGPASPPARPTSSTPTVGPPASAPTGGPDSLLFHGTRPPSPPGNPASAAQWWMPGQHFHNYLLHGQNLNLYGGAHYFQWEGGYRDDAREIAARNLYDWLQTHLHHPVKLLAHSHGGNVALATTHLTSGNTVINGAALNVEQLALLSTPIHWSAYYPSPGRVHEVVDIRVRHDLAIYAEYSAVLLQGGNLPSQRIPPAVVAQGNPPIREHVIQGHWGNHFACYNASIWQAQGINL